MPQRRKREKRQKTEEEENLPRRASGRIAAAGGALRNYNEKSLFALSSFFGDDEPSASAASRAAAAPRGPPRVPSSCHSCRQKRDEMGGPAAEGSSCWRCDGARGRFCRGCLAMRYGISVEAVKLANERAAAEVARREEAEETEGKEEETEGKEEEEEEEDGGKSAAVGDASPPPPPPPAPSSLPSPCGWLCPHCYEEVFGAEHGWICNSSLCLKRRPVPIRPTGVAVFESRAAGHASVAHALQARLTENGKLNGGLVGPRREGLGAVVEGLTDLESVERRRAEEKRERERAAAAAAAAAAAEADDAAASGGVASSSAAAAAPVPPPAAAGKENDGGNGEENAVAKRPRGRPPKSATARAETAQAAQPPSLPLAASAALPQPAA